MLDEPVPEPMTPRVEPVEPAPTDHARDPDHSVLMRAQAAAAPDPDADDPYFAELRRAITDPQPLGPRDDEGETPFEGSVEDIFDPNRKSRRGRRR